MLAFGFMEYFKILFCILCGALVLLIIFWAIFITCDIWKGNR